MEIAPETAKFGGIVKVVKVKINAYRGDIVKYAVYAYRG